MLNQEFVDAFVRATIKVLELQAGIKARPHMAQLKKNDDTFRAEISGVIPLESETFSGSLVISFPAQTYLQVMSGMLNEPINEVSSDILDGTSELTNMIFGQAKIFLNGRGHGIQMAFPKVVTGQVHTIDLANSFPSLVVPFDSDAGDFFIEISRLKAA